MSGTIKVRDGKVETAHAISFKPDADGDGATFILIDGNGEAFAIAQVSGESLDGIIGDIEIFAMSKCKIVQ
jgi:hypothetical protein